jgi:hypothetical protein
MLVLHKYFTIMRKLTLLFITLIFFSSACHISGKNIKGNGNRTTLERPVSTFDGISVVGDMDVILTTGSSYLMKIEGDENLLEYVKTEKKGSTLRIGTKEGYSLQSASGIKVYLTAPTILNIEVVGSGDFTTASKLMAEKRLKIAVTGSGTVKMEVDAPEVTAQIAGSGDMQLTGTTRSFNADISGSGNARCFNLLSEETDVDISGSGEAQVFASKRLEANINGSGSVSYKGSPSVKQNINGSGQLQKASN